MSEEEEYYEADRQEAFFIFLDEFNKDLKKEYLAGRHEDILLDEKIEEDFMDFCKKEFEDYKRERRYKYYER